MLVVPFAATTPFEQWLLPRRHQACFGQVAEADLQELGRVLQRALQRLRAVLSDPPYNYVIDSWPSAIADADLLHWRLRIVPAIGSPAGFELGAGISINPSLPEDDAARLRAAIHS